MLVIAAADEAVVATGFICFSWWAPAELPQVQRQWCHVERSSPGHHHAHLPRAHGRKRELHPCRWSGKPDLEPDLLVFPLDKWGHDLDGDGAGDEPRHLWRRTVKGVRVKRRLVHDVGVVSKLDYPALRDAVEAFRRGRREVLVFAPKKVASAQ